MCISFDVTVDVSTNENTVTMPFDPGFFFPELKQEEEEVLRPVHVSVSRNGIKARREERHKRRKLRDGGIFFFLNLFSVHQALLILPRYSFYPEAQLHKPLTSPLLHPKNVKINVNQILILYFPLFLPTDVLPILLLPLLLSHTTMC